MRRSSFKRNGWSGGRGSQRGDEVYYLMKRGEERGAVHRLSQQRPWWAWADDGSVMGVERQIWRRCEAKRWVEMVAARSAR